MAEMFRSFRAAAALFALTLLALTACADSSARRASAPAGAPVVSAPAASPTAPKAAATAPRSTPAPGAPAGDDQSLRLSGDTSGGGSCRQQCERSNNICMDSVAARVQSGVERPDAVSPFTPSDNCSYQLRTCYQRCNTAPR